MTSTSHADAPPSYTYQDAVSTGDLKSGNGLGGIDDALAAQSLDDMKEGIQRASTSAKVETELVKGCPALLLPVNKDWSPTQRDLDAPQVLPRRNFGGRLSLLFTRSAGKPLKPLPASFDRVPTPPSTTTEMSTSASNDSKAPTYSSFEPFYLPSQHKMRLKKGFEARYPASIMVDHDVSVVDWDRFLVNLQVCAAPRGYEYLIANLAPAPLIVLQAGYGNYWITQSIMIAFRKRHIPEVLALVETYQHRFFQPRSLDVFVAVGTKRISGHYPGDLSYMDAPSVELGVPLKKTKRVAKGKVNDDLKRLPKDERKYIKRQRKHERKLKKITNKAEGLPKRQHIHEQHADLYGKRLKEIQAEREQGYEMKKEGKYRIVIQPQEGPAPQPPSDWIRKMEKMDKGWGKKKPAPPPSMVAGQDIEQR